MNIAEIHESLNKVIDGTLTSEKFNSLIEKAEIRISKKVNEQFLQSKNKEQALGLYTNRNGVVNLTKDYYVESNKGIVLNKINLIEDIQRLSSENKKFTGFFLNYPHDFSRLSVSIISGASFQKDIPGSDLIIKANPDVSVYLPIFLNWEPMICTYTPIREIKGRQKPTEADIETLIKELSGQLKVIRTPEFGMRAGFIGLPYKII